MHVIVENQVYFACVVNDTDVEYIACYINAGLYTGKCEILSAIAQCNLLTQGRIHSLCWEECCTIKVAKD